MKNYIQLTDKYRLQSDGAMNLILYELYEKTDGVGRHGKPTGEYDYRALGFYRNLDHVARKLVDKEVFEFDEDLVKIAKNVEKLRDDIRKTLSENIGVKWLE